MAIINLRRYYPHYPKEKFMDVPDEDEAAANQMLKNLTAAIIRLFKGLCPY